MAIWGAQLGVHSWGCQGVCESTFNISWVWFGHLGASLKKVKVLVWVLVHPGSKWLHGSSGDSVCQANLEEKMINMVWNGHHIHSNLSIDQFYVNPCFYHRESVFHFSEKILASCNISKEVRPLIVTSIKAMIRKQRKTTRIYSLTVRSIAYHPDRLSLWPSSLC